MPGLGAYGRQLTDVSLSPSKRIKKKMSSGEEKKELIKKKEKTLTKLEFYIQQK